MKIMAWNGIYGCEAFECNIEPYTEHNIEKWLEYYKKIYPYVWIEEVD